MEFSFTNKNVSLLRDPLLDIAKGIAIILVVIGHTLQHNGGSFDNSAAFRFIYSFHMPLFVFLSGCTASIWISKFNHLENTAGQLKNLFERVSRSAVQLLLPFIGWSIVAFFALKHGEALEKYVIKVLKQPDYSLWFLPCIFWCILFTCSFYAGIFLVRKFLTKLRLDVFNNWLSLPMVQLVLLLACWDYARTILPNEYGLVFVNWFSGGLFLYFAFGLYFFRALSILNNKSIRILPYIIFFGLVPYWSKSAPYELLATAPTFITDIGLKKYFSIIVATSGTLVFFDLAKILLSLNYKYLNRILCILGVGSLGIYAIHIYFIGIQPQVLGTMVISLLCFEVILLIPILRTVLLGK